MLSAGVSSIPVGAAVEHAHRVEALHQHPLGFLDHAGYTESAVVARLQSAPAVVSAVAEQVARNES